MLAAQTFDLVSRERMIRLENFTHRVKKDFNEGFSFSLDILVGSGQWAVGSGQWAMNNGHWIVEQEIIRGCRCGETYSRLSAIKIQAKNRGGQAVATKTDQQRSG